MRSRSVFRLALVGLLATVSAGLKCADGPLDIGTSTPSTSVAGTWQGPVVDLTMRLVLTQTGTDITGTGTMTQSGTPFALTVTGTNTNGTFSMQINEVEHAPFTFTGTVQLNGSVRTLVGVGNGSGLTNEPITLTRQ